MAKWGEGDPRWIVEERPDATNVNNWHWTEKNASQWSQDKFKDLFLGLIIEDEKIGRCEIKELTKTEGEASANNRKGKLIFFYEWVIKMSWKGKLNGSSTEVEGKIEIPNLSEENSADEVDVNVKLNDDAKNGDLLKEMLRQKGTLIIRDKIGQYIRDLKEEFSVGMILPKKGETINSSGVAKPVARVEPIQKEKKTNEDRMKGLDIGGTKIETKSLQLRHTFKCTADEIYRALTVPEMVQAFTRGPCKLEAVKGGKFEMFGGNVVGEFIELDSPKKISQKWRFKQWPSGHYSTVTLTIEQREDSTDISLHQTGIPSNDLERTRDGWSGYYWESLKKTFGFGAMLL